MTPQDDRPVTGAYNIDVQFDGWAYQRSGPDERQPARIRLRLDGLIATLEDGSTIQIPWKGMRLQREHDGGFVYCIAKDGALRAFSDDEGFLRAVEAAGGNDLGDAIARLEGQNTASPLRHKLSCLAVAVLCGFAVFSIPRLFRGAVDGAVDALPYSVDEAIGEAAFESMDMGGEEVTDEAVRSVVAAIIARLEPHTNFPEATFQFKVIESDTVNAFALPGGYLAVFTGLLTQASSPEEVAGVIAHEMAHVTQRHSLRRIAHSVGLWASISLLFGNADVLSSIARDLFTLAGVNSYSQENETEADLEGVRMMIAAGIDPHGLSHFFGHLNELHGDIPDSLAWISTHPQHSERIAAIEALAEGAGADRDWQPLDVDWDGMLVALGVDSEEPHAEEPALNSSSAPSD